MDIVAALSGGRVLGIAARIAGALAAVAGITFLYRQVFAVNSTTVALSYLLAILVVATGWGFPEAAFASVAAMLCLNFYFLPPIGTLTIADPQNWVALVAFLLTAAISSHLSARARRRTLEADARREEMERLYAFSRSLMITEGQAEVAQQVASQVAQVFGAQAVAVFDRSLRHWSSLQTTTPWRERRSSARASMRCRRQSSSSRRSYRKTRWRS